MTSADALLDRALSLHHAGRLDEAAALYRQALGVEPGLAGYLLGRALEDLGRLEEARRAYRQSLAAAPGNADALNDLGALLHRMGRPEGAEKRLREALAVAPDRADVRHNLAVVLTDRGAHDQALEHARRAVALAPDFADAHHTLGNILLALDRPEAAEAALRRALELAPGAASVLASLGAVLERLGRADSALACLERAAEASDSAEAWSNLGKVWQGQGRADRALAAFDRALAASPELALARLNRGLLHLERGDLARGWADYAARFAAQRDHRGRRFAAPEWRGEELSGKRILVWREQGVGDELMFASCYPDLIRHAETEGGRTVIECDRRLVPLFARSFPAAEVRAESGAPGDMDFHVPAGSLPALLRPSPAAFGAGGWLVPDSARVAAWRGRLAEGGPEPTVGIAWRSRLTTGERGGAYARLDAWGPLLSVPGVRFVNLQYDRCDAVLEAAERRFGIAIARWPDLDLMNDLENAAALTAALDLVISAPTAVAEMAGALGVPTWRLMPGDDWTRLGTAARPWYPAQRPFQPRPGEGLASVLERLGAALSGVLP
ncbi:tetratricopeptide repeat protein [Azospirillum sp.]|uniref:tetratricopeptide repeat protein n=1 Tax=Azospirillum sp. TaxID=34012 RepID=UPI002D4C1CE2|nr:tetratricopeptide repeat protein [Azospirillum sp.]HYD66562.1 tetratricopeptide repeat protein [Azospirillum sp.]